MRRYGKREKDLKKEKKKKEFFCALRRKREDMELGVCTEISYHVFFFRQPTTATEFIRAQCCLCDESHLYEALSSVVLEISWVMMQSRCCRIDVPSGGRFGD